MIRTLDPTYEPMTRPRGQPQRRMARSPGSLSGIRLGLLANGKSKSVEILDAIHEELVRQDAMGITEVLRAKKGDVTTPPRPEVVDRFVGGSDVVITAIGN